MNIWLLRKTEQISHMGPRHCLFEEQRCCEVICAVKMHARVGGSDAWHLKKIFFLGVKQVAEWQDESIRQKKDSL